MSAAAAAASGAVASGDAAQRHLKDFLLDLRHNQARYDFTQGRAEIDRFCDDCLLYFESVGLFGIDARHVLHIIETTHDLANDPVIRDARAVIGVQRKQQQQLHGNGIVGTAPVEGVRTTSKHVLHPAAAPAPRVSETVPLPPFGSGPDVASTAFAATTGNTEAGAFSLVDLMRQSNLFGSSSNNSGRNFEFGGGVGDDEGDAEFGPEDDDTLRLYQEYLDREFARVQETVQHYLHAAVESREYVYQSAAGCGTAPTRYDGDEFGGTGAGDDGGGGPWYSLCSVTYAAEVHEDVIAWVRESFSYAHAATATRRRPFCEDIFVYMSEGPVFGCVFAFRFLRDPNPPGIEQDGDAAARTATTATTAAAASAGANADKRA